MTDTKPEKTDREVVEGLFERWGPETRKNPSGNPWQLIDAPEPFYCSGPECPGWAPLSSLDDLRPALAATLADAERALELYGAIFDLEWAREDATDLVLFGLRLTTTPEGTAKLARAIVAAWEGV